MLLLRPFALLMVFLIVFPALAEPLSVEYFYQHADPRLVLLAGFKEELSPLRVSKALAQCESSTEKPEETALCDFARLLRGSLKKKPEFPWSSIHSPILFFGERHLDPEVKIFLSHNLEKLRARGFSTLALEMFNSSQQDFLDQYVKGALSLEQLALELKRVWNYDASAYLTLFQAAKENGFRLLALDARDSGNTRKMIFYFEEMYRRDAHMAQILAQAWGQHPGEKIVVLAGRMHALTSFSTPALTRSLPEILDLEHGLKTHSILTFSAQDSSTLNSIFRTLHLPSAADLIFAADHQQFYSHHYLFFPFPAAAGGPKN